MKMTKEEKVKNEQLKAMARSILQGRGNDLAAVHDVMRDMKKVLIEMLYDEELKEHLGFPKSSMRPENSDNYRNGSYEKTVKTSNGELKLNVPRDRNGEFEPKIVKKYQGDIFGIEDKIISLYGCGMSTRDISDNIHELYGFDVSAETISNITNRVISDMKDWQSRALKSVYAVVFMDGMVFKIKKDGIIQKRTVYTCIGIDMDGKKEVLSLHIGGSESAKYWLSVMNDMKSRGVQDVLIFCTDNLTGLNDAINACYPNADHQKCIVHQIRNSVKHVSYKDLKEVCNDLKSIYKAPNGEIGFKNLAEFGEKWDNKYSYIAKSWIDNWAELSTFWKYPEEIRRLIYTTNPIESFNRNMRKYTKNKPTFQSEESLAKSLFLGILKVEKKWTSKVQNWGIIYSQLTILFADRLSNCGSIL